MKLNIFKIIEGIRASYWFIPSLMAFLAIILGAVMVWVDVEIGDDWLSAIGWYQSVKPDGAHEVLSTIAGSMITVAGVVFSITIVALAFAAGQYGPRVLTNFMRDRGNQITLGTFIATFVYCLIVLRTIRGGDEEFVPQAAVLFGILLALCSIAVLIYFIHHIPLSIHVNEFISRIGRQLIDAVEERFPAFIGDPADPEEEVQDRSSTAVAALKANNAADRRGVAAIRAARTGYVQAISDRTLMTTACSRDLVLRLRYRPGDFVRSGAILADAWPATRLGDDGADEVRSCFAIGNKRTPAGDMLFMVDELVEIAARALSTGINDPYTATACLDWLGAAAAEMARRRLPHEERTDGEGVVRVLGRPISFEEFISQSFGQARQYFAGDKNATLHALATLGDIGASCVRREQLDVLIAEGERLCGLASVKLDASSCKAVRARAAELAELLKSGVGEIEAQQPSWLGGSAL